MGKRNFKSPISREPSNITFLRPAKLAEENTEGVILEGTFIESLPNQFDDKKSDYKFTDDKGNTVVLNGAGNLGYQMGFINAGDFVQITYNGKKRIEKGKMEGRMAHNFEVLRDEIEEEETL